MVESAWYPVAAQMRLAPMEYTERWAVAAATSPPAVDGSAATAEPRVRYAASSPTRRGSNGRTNNTNVSEDVAHRRTKAHRAPRSRRRRHSTTANATSSTRIGTTANHCVASRAAVVSDHENHAFQRPPRTAATWLHTLSTARSMNSAYMRLSCEYHTMKGAGTARIAATIPVRRS